MARPERNNIQSGLAAWDADVEENFEILFDNPIPLPENTTSRTMAQVDSAYAPASYDRCFIAQNVSDGDLSGYYLLFSNGSDWLVCARQVADQSDAAGWADGTAEGDFNALLALLREAGILKSWT